MSAIVFLFIAFFIAVAYVTREEKHNTESFQILGAAAPYHAQYVQCLNACGQEDPSSSFSSPNNLMCGVYCDYIISNMAGAGVPPELVPTSSHQKTCEAECRIEGASHREIRTCISNCTSQKEVSSWCAELWCPYSLYPTDLCMNMCTSSNGANSNSNSWKWGRYG